MSCRLYKEAEHKTIPMYKLAIGKFGIITDEMSAYKGSIVFKTKSNECVMLDTKDGNYSKHSSVCVRVLQPGELIEVGE